METLIKVIQSTSIPTILIVVGSFILVLAFVTKIGGWIEVSPEQRRWAIPIGLFVLVTGLFLNFASPPDIQPSLRPSPGSGTSPQPPIGQNSSSPQLPNTACQDSDGMFYLARPDVFYSPPNATDGYALAWKSKTGGFYISNSSSGTPIFYPDYYLSGKAKRDVWLSITNTPFSICVDSENQVFGKFDK